MPVRRQHRRERRLLRSGQAGLAHARRREAGHGTDQLVHIGVLQSLAVAALDLLDVVGHNVWFQRCRIEYVVSKVILKPFCGDSVSVLSVAGGAIPNVVEVGIF